MVAKPIKLAVLLVLLLLVPACGGKLAINKQASFAPVPARERLYVIPFNTVMVPREVKEGIFDQFVDALNDLGSSMNYNFVILKQGLEGVDAAWLADKYYISGDVFAYVEESGCCATTIRVQSRLQVFQPETSEPTLVLNYPREVFFEHDYSSLPAERTKLAADIASNLATQLLQALKGS